MRDLTWMDSALCAQTGPDEFFPEGAGQNLHKAKRICGTCPVRIECGEHAQHLEGDLSHGLRHGAWGGMYPTERANLGGRHRNAERDAAILRLDARGVPPEEIAAQLGISDRTVFRVKAAQAPDTSTERSAA
ncbi:WhiB family transcriptional regulator [Streptomyces sp. NPDC002908]|uniref:WhiB family transcriptional regulator n=1 Tax=Streptomyces sp. NPDC002908 TaxID=3364670 RepID=UPI0036A0973C